MEPSKVQSLFSEAAASTSGGDTSTQGGQGGSGQGQQQTQSGQSSSQQKTNESQTQTQTGQTQGSQGGQQTQQTGQGKTEGQTQTQQTGAAKVELTPEQLAEAFHLATQKKDAAANTQQQQRQPTEEELDKLFNRFKVTPELFAEIFDAEKPEVAIAAMNKFKQGVVKEALTMAMHLIQDNIGQFKQTVQPYLSFADQQRELVLRDQYFSKFPKHKGMDPIIEQVHQQLKAEGYKPDGKGGINSLFDEVGKRVDAIVAQLQAAAGGQQQTQQSTGDGQQQQQQATQKPGMSTLRSGGQGGESGGGQGSSGTSKEAKVRKLFT